MSTSTDLHYLTIAEASSLIRSGKLSPVELTDALLHRIEALEPQLNAFITRDRGSRTERSEAGRGRDRSGTFSRAAARHPVRAQGHLQHQRHPHDRRLEDRDRQRSRRRRGRRRAAARRGRDPPRQTGDPRVRARRTVVRSAVAARAQSVEPRALHRRLVERLGRRSGGRPRSRFAGLRHRRLDTRSGVLLRHHGIHADVRAREPLRRHAELVHVRSLRAHGAHGRGLRAASAGDRRLRSARLGQHRAGDSRLPRRAGGRHQGAAHRRSAPLLGRRCSGARRTCGRRWKMRSPSSGRSARKSRTRARGR